MKVFAAVLLAIVGIMFMALFGLFAFTATTSGIVFLSIVAIVITAIFTVYGILETLV